MIAGRDFIWQELTIDSPAGRIEPYEMKFLRDGQVYLQLYGFKRGSVWQPGDLDGSVPPASEAAEQLHHRYIDYQARQDADGMADDFFTADARLVTARLNIEGREALRSFFRHKFETESGFHLESTRNITGDDDYVWFEATAGGSLGMRTVYDVMLLQGGQVSLQLVGTLEGVLPANVPCTWPAGDPGDLIGAANQPDPIENKENIMSYSPEANNAIAEKFFNSVWNKGDFSVLDTLISPDAVDHSTVGGKPKMEKGSASFRAIVSMFRSAMPDIQLTIDDEVYAGDKVVHRWHLVGTDTGGVMGMPPSGKQLTFSGTTIVRMADGKIVERWANVDELGLLQQLGVVPPPPGS